MVQFLRSLSFSGLLFAGIGAVVYYRFPQYFSGIHPYLFISSCGVVGAALQQGISKAIIFVLGPIGRFLVFYENLLELGMLRSRNAIGNKEHNELVQKLCEKRFLGP
jgi:hypothetical protein